MAFPLTFVLDEQHLAAHRADQLAALVADSEHLLKHGRAANDGGVDLVAPAVEEHPEHLRRFLARHPAPDGQR